MYNNMIKAFITLFIFIVSSSAFSTGVYKWKDADGNIHYGDRPTNTAEKMKVRSGHTPDKHLGERMQRRDRLLSVLNEEREAKKSEKILLAQQKAHQEKKCSEAKKNLSKYKSAGYLYKLDEQGNRNILEDKEHALALERAQESVDQWCG